MMFNIDDNVHPDFEIPPISVDRYSPKLIQGIKSSSTPTIEAKLRHVVVWTQEDTDRLDKAITEILIEINDDKNNKV